MIKCPFSKCKISLFIFLCLNVILSTNAQIQDDGLKHKMDINLHEKPIGDILKYIEKNTPLIFSYKTDLLNDISLISITLHQATVEKVLEKTFEKTGISYTFYNNYVILFKNVSPQEATRVDTVRITEKIMKTDTLVTFLRDTVYVEKEKIEYRVKIDTIYQVDTIYRTEKVQNQVETDKKSYLPFFDVYVSGGIFSYKDELLDSRYQDNFDRIQDSEKPLSRYSIGMNSGFYKNNWKIGSGLGISVVQQTANYNFTSITPDSSTITAYAVEEFVDIVKSDSIFVYVPGRDTTWYYDYDTLKTYNIDITYKQDTSNYDYQGKNQFIYLTIPIKIGYEFPISNKLDVLTEASLLIDFLMSAKGYSLSQSKYAELIPLSDIPISPICALAKLGGGLSYQLNNKQSVYGSFSYSWMINSMYSATFPVRRKRNTVEFSLGYRFF